MAKPKMPHHELSKRRKQKRIEAARVRVEKVQKRQPLFHGIGVAAQTLFDARPHRLTVNSIAREVGGGHD